MTPPPIVPNGRTQSPQAAAAPTASESASNGTPAVTVAPVRNSLGSKATAAITQTQLASDLIGPARMLAALPYVIKHGRLGLWAFSLLPVVGLGPNNLIVPHEGGKWNLWGKSYKASNVLGKGIAVAQGVVAIPNLVEGVQADGAKGLVDTRAGRTGVIEATNGLLNIGIMALAGIKEGGRLGFLNAAVGADMLGSLPVVIAGKFSMPLMLLNESGTFDSLDKANKNSTGQTVVAGVKNLPATLEQMFIP